MSIYLPRRSVIARCRKNGWDEPCKSRGLRTVLWAAGGEIPPADPAIAGWRVMGSSFWATGSRRANVGCARKASRDCGIKSGPRPGVTGVTRSRTSLPRSIHSCVAGSAISSMPTATPSRPSTALSVAVCERSCADSFIVPRRVTAFAITRDGRMPSSLILGCSRCLRPFDLRANPDVVTTDWRARRGKTAHRVRREGTAIAVSYPYSLAVTSPSLSGLCSMVFVAPHKAESTAKCGYRKLLQTS
jgi:hypothetical protein